MRARLVIVFLVPLVTVLCALGGAYAWSTARSVQQEFYSDRFGDVSYFVTSARQALRSGNSTVLESEVARYHDLYGAAVAVIDRSGTPWVSTGVPLNVLDEKASGKVQLALSGRRGEQPSPELPWVVQDAVLVEPVFDDGDVIGAVMVSSDMEAVRQGIARHWISLVFVSLGAVAVGWLVVTRLANWVLAPVRRVDEAMEAIEQGHMEARIADETGPPELRRMISLFNRMAGEVERVVSKQQEFALTASHELRNPLNALLLRVESLALVLDGEGDEEVEATREEGRRMTQILDALLRLARGATPDSDFETVDLSELVRRRVEAWRPVANRSFVRIQTEIEARALAETDTIVVESAFDAVIDNALKYAPAHSQIEVVTERHGEFLEVSIRDHGPGIPKEELERATERFWRGSNSAEKHGSGLGLAIANDLISSAGGQLRVDAPPNGGLRVTFRFRVAMRGETS